MREKDVVIETKDGAIPAFVTHPDEDQGHSNRTKSNNKRREYFEHAPARK